jgi:hypothetical protein
MDPNTNGKVVTRLDASGTDNVDAQAVLRDRVAQALSIGAISDTHQTILSGSLDLVKLLGDWLGRGKAQRANGGLSIRNAQELILSIVLVAQTLIGSQRQANRGGSRRRQGGRLGKSQARESCQEDLGHVGRHLGRVKMARWDF